MDDSIAIFIPNSNYYGLDNFTFYGSDGEWIGKSDGADDSNIEAAKGGLSAALKRAAVQWGIARYLYHPHAFDANKNPAMWATPEGYDEVMAQRDANDPIEKLSKVIKDVE